MGLPLFEPPPFLNLTAAPPPFSAMNSTPRPGAAALQISPRGVSNPGLFNPIY